GEDRGAAKILEEDAPCVVRDAASPLLTMTRVVAFYWFRHPEELAKRASRRTQGLPAHHIPSFFAGAPMRRPSPSSSSCSSPSTATSTSRREGSSISVSTTFIRRSRRLGWKRASASG